MPWHVAKSADCPSDKPWAVIKSGSGEKVACHPSEGSAHKQMAALYANEPEAKGSIERTNVMGAQERRYTMVPVELRSAGEKRTIGGYAAMFDRLSNNLGGFVERVTPSFFNKSRGDGWPDVMARYNHDDNMLLGTTGSGTLRLSIDDQGLVYEVTPPVHRSDIIELVERGDVRKSSFAFITIDDEWSLTEQGFPQRSLISGKLIDVAPVNKPAYDDTTAGLRSLADKVGAPFEEVRSASDNNNLLKYIAKRKGHKKVIDLKPTTFGPAALADLEKMRDPLGDLG